MNMNAETRWLYAIYICVRYNSSQQIRGEHLEFPLFPLDLTNPVNPSTKRAISPCTFRSYPFIVVAHICTYVSARTLYLSITYRYYRYVNHSNEPQVFIDANVFDRV